MQGLARGHLVDEDDAWLEDRDRTNMGAELVELELPALVEVECLRELEQALPVASSLIN